MSDDKPKHNHTGQTPTDIPSEELINPPKKKREKKVDRRSDFNSTAKDPNLGSRNNTGR
ncbi:hypothetical protein [Pedobacter sp. SYSU D00535]|uniref:hypothetical protein n=1 Tax=Pedobacter sp. SYSU D00535 TaxID=2810308 RepID=UPI001A9623D7|nr:hypothetical protein [Pedobacter sp. SYSU D00535]